MVDPPELDPGRESGEPSTGERRTRDDAREAERRLAERASELDLLQSLGRRAAEARTAGELFGSVVQLLHESGELELALVGYEWDSAPQLTLFLARPFDERYLTALVERGRRFLGWNGPVVSQPTTCRLTGYDLERETRIAFNEEDLLLLPLLRRGKPAACMLVVAADCVSERRLRLLYSASNQLALHLERILAVREAETGRFRSIIDAMPQGVLLTDCDLRLLHANRAAARMLASVGLSDRATLAGDTDRLGLGALVQAVREGLLPCAEGEVQPAEEQTWSVTVSPTTGAGGAIEGLVFVLNDVTERRRLERQLAHSEKMSSLGQMISGVAHELNNPLASIVGYAQLVRGSGGTGERIERQLSVLSREAERCKRIVQNLLSFARRHEPEWKPLSLNQIVTNVRTLLEYQLRVDGIRLEETLNSELPSMEGDAHELEQVLVNLLTNAAHAIRKTGRPGVVSVSTAPAEPGFIALEVRDNGPGIPESTRARIFDPFFTTKAPGEGTGLGLSLAYGMVTAHGGTIEVTADPGPGTTFRLRFPLSGKRPEEHRPERAAPIPFSTRAGRILVVDDDEAVAQLICDTLRADGHELECADDGRRALEQLARCDFDLIISDVKMPGMSGKELHVELRRARPRMARRMLLTTGDTLGPDLDELARRTGLEVLRKPFDVEELRQSVRARLER